MNLFVFLSVLSLLYTVLCYESLVGPTGVLHYNKTKSFEGLTLYAPTLTREAFLINSEGDLINHWDLPLNPSLYVTLTDEGTLLTGLRIPGNTHVPIGGYGRGVVELNWEGDEIWRYDLNNDDSVQHHCFFRKSDGNTMILGWERVSQEEFGRKSFVPESVFTMKQNVSDFWLDFWVEVNHEKEVVKEWHLKDHLGEGPTKWDPEYKLPDSVAEVGPLYPNFDYSHFNTLTMNEETGQVLMCSRNLGEIYLVDYETGEMQWRWGNPSAYDPDAERPGWYSDGDQELFGPHHATFLPNGNIQIFDNGDLRKDQFSRILEVNPATDKIEWEWRAWDSTSFFSIRQGAAQRLPNDNVLVTSSNKGHLFEITREGAVVWDFVNPHSSLWSTPRCVIKDRDQPAFWHEKNFLVNMIHRAERLSPDHPGLQGKDLTPKGPLTHCPSFYRLYQDFQGDSTSFIRQGLE